MLTAKYLFICANVYFSVLNAEFDAFKVFVGYLAVRRRKLY